MVVLELFDDRNRKFFTKNDFFFLPALKITLPLSAYNFNYNVAESIRDWNVESLTQVKLEHSGVVFLCVKVLLFDCLVGLFVVAWDVLASNYKRTQSDLDEEGLGADYVLQVEDLDAQFAKAVAVCLIYALNARRNLNRLHY